MRKHGICADKVAERKNVVGDSRAGLELQICEHKHENVVKEVAPTACSTFNEVRLILVKKLLETISSVCRICNGDFRRLVEELELDNRRNTH